MKSEHNKKRHTHRLPPCPAYDVEGMESWLSDMAHKGLFLAKDGFFAGVATFEYGSARNVKYRLEAAQKSTSMWSEDGGEPDPEQVELSERYSWSYIAKRGDFYIYRSFDPGARELNTDPEVQALALNVVKKRKGSAAFTLLFWLILYPILWLRGGLLLTMVNMKTWLFLLTLLFVLWMLADSLVAFVSLGKLQKKLRDGNMLSSALNWRKRTLQHHATRFLQIALAIILICIFVNNWSVSVMDDDKVQLDNYVGDMPFATILDFAGEGGTDYHMTMMGMSMGFNTVREWSDWLAPRCIEYNEHAQVTLSDGRILDGGLYVDYYETVSPIIAERLTKECLRIDEWEKGFELTETPDLNVDFAAAYYNELHFPVILIQEGNVVIRAMFYQTSSNYTMNMATWAGILADSIAEQ